MKRASKAAKRNGTSTSSFGTSGRENHDSSKFYSGRLYQQNKTTEDVVFIENRVPSDVLDTVIPKSSEKMTDLPDASVHLMVTSPPYNVGKEYDDDLTLDEYLSFLLRVWKEVYRVLVPGGRACINIANLGRRPYIPLNAFIARQMIDIGFLMRGEIIWQKGSSAGTSTAWGSWMSPSNPTLRDTHEYILVFSKDSFKRVETSNRRSSIAKEEFLEFTKSVWTFPAESARKVGHPAPFPVELPFRLIQLYTFENEVVLDPFMGSGQAGIAAVKTNRHYVGYELDKKYAKLAQKRVGDFQIANSQQSLVKK
ncbi:MAG: site-specific DNA-methyltransferase [Anaerolineales bacterium]|nr:site-specific DNA-methyltransferase [Anaerolineales bacterium]